METTGLVAYLDLLGTSYLTKKQSEKAYEPILYNNIKIFHKVIYNAIQGKNIIVQVLSDSVFLACDDQTANCNQLLFCLAEIFRKCILEGVLLRCGLSEGDYKIEKTELLDNTIFGSAVTNAVNLEKKGKGTRIFTTSNVASYVDIDNCGYLFLAYEDKSTYKTFDILNWPILINSYSYRQSDWPLTPCNVNPDLKQLIQENLFIESMLRSSTKFIWNADTDEGKQHLISSVAYISEIIDKIIKEQDESNRFQINVDTFESVIENTTRDEERVYKHYDYCWTEIFKKYLGDDTYVVNIPK